MATSSKTAAAGKQAKKKVNISDQNLLLIITIVIFLVMYLGAIIFLEAVSGTLRIYLIF